jgi:hypothetical protein
MIPLTFTNDLGDDSPDVHFFSAGVFDGFFFTFHFMVDLPRAFGDEEQSSEDQDEIASADGAIFTDPVGNAEEWLLEFHHPGNGQ